MNQELNVKMRQTNGMMVLQAICSEVWRDAGTIARDLLDLCPR